MGLPAVRWEAPGASLMSAESRMKEARDRDVERSRLAHVAGMKMSQLDRDMYHAHRRAVQAQNRSRAMGLGMTLRHAPGLDGSFGPYEIDRVHDEQTLGILRVLREIDALHSAQS